MGVMAMADKNENDEAVRIEKEAAQRRLFRKLEQRNRLMRLADAGGPARTREQREIEALKSYIDQWCRWMASGVASSSDFPGSSSFAEPGRSWEHAILDPLDTPNIWAIKIVDAAMTELAGLPDGMRMRAALKVRWLNEVMNAVVFRHSRIATSEIDDLADAGERAMIPLVKRRGLPLE